MSANAAHGHGGATTSLFLKVWVVLIVFTLVEVYLAYVHLSLGLMLTILMGLSVIKAALIIAYFMHLRYERFSLFLTLVPMGVFCIVLLAVFFPDSLRLVELRFPR